MRVRPAPAPTFQRERRAALQRLAALATVGLGVPLAARRAVAAEAFPSRPLRIVVPYSVGLGPDIVARAVAERLAATWKQPVVIENRPGASGIVALSELRKAAPDGYTLFVGDAGSLSANPLLYTSLPYDVARDVAPITTLFNATFMIFTRANGYATLGEMLRDARREPGRVSYASLGNGHPSQLAVETFARAAGVEFLHVPFREAGAMMTSITTGDVDFTVLSMNTSSGMVKAGKWKALAVAAPERLRDYPDIPTLVQAGGPPVTMTPWAALIGVAGTPQPVLDAIHREVIGALRDPAIRTRIEGLGFDVLGCTPAELSALIRRDAAQYEPLVKSGRVRVE